MREKTICTLHGFLGLTGVPCPHCKSTRDMTDVLGRLAPLTRQSEHCIHIPAEMAIDEIKSLRAQLAAAKEENAALREQLASARAEVWKDSMSALESMKIDPQTCGADLDKAIKWNAKWDSAIRIVQSAAEKVKP